MSNKILKIFGSVGFAIFFGILGFQIHQPKLIRGDRSPAAATSSQNRCREALLSLMRKPKGLSPESMGQRAREALNSRKVLTPKFVQNLRNWVISFLTYRNGRHYPVVALDTTPKANFWAKRSLGLIEDSNGGLILDEVNKEIETLLVLVKSFKSRKDAWTDEMMTLTSKYLGYEEALKSDAIHSINVPYHQYKDALPNGEAQSIFLPTKPAVKIHRDAAIKKMKSLQRMAHEINVEQAKAVKQLETYRAELRHYMSINSGQDLADVSAGFLREIEELYVDAVGGLLPAYHPPSPAWNTLRWEMWTVAWGERLRRYIPKNSDFLKQIDHIISMTPEERRRLGIDESIIGAQNWADSRIKRWIKTVRWGNAGALSALGTGGVWTLGSLTDVVDVKELVNSMFLEKRKRYECAELLASSRMDAFYVCLDEYLRLIFPETYLLARDDLVQAVVNGEFSDPEIEVAVNAVIQEGYKAFGANERREAITKLAVEHVSRNNILSDNFEIVLLEMEDEEFLEFVVGRKDIDFEEKENVGTYVKVKFPLASANKDVRLLLRAMILSKTPQEKSKFLNTLTQMPLAKELAEEINAVLVKRSSHLGEGLTQDEAFQKSLEEAKKLLEN